MAKFGQVTDDFLWLNDFQPPRGFRQRVRTLKRSGKVRRKISIEVESQPILHNLNHLELGRGPAEALVDEIVSDFNKITEVASAWTRNFRRRASEAFDQGKPWAMERYAGGRIGAKPPDGTSVRKLIDSGRLKDGLTARSGPDGWTVYAPANRLTPLKGWYNDPSGAWFQKLLADVKRLIPALTPRKLMQRKDFQRAITKSLDDMITIGRMTTEAKRSLLRRQKMAALRAAARLVTTL